MSTARTSTTADGAPVRSDGSLLFCPADDVAAHDHPVNGVPAPDPEAAAPRVINLFSTTERGDTEEVVDLTHAGVDPTAGDRALVGAMATATEAIEYVERARGLLYTFHHLLTRADILFTEVAETLREQGRSEDAEALEAGIIGRDVLDDRWSFEVVEEFDDGFYEPVKDTVRELERRTVGGRRHVRESLAKAARAAASADRTSRPGSTGPETRAGSVGDTELPDHP